MSGNWIKIVQRLPVRVALDEEQIKKHPLRLGLSMETTVNLEDQTGYLVPKNSKGSPNYETNIFKEEEEGSSAIIDAIFNENLDPTLAQFVHEPLYQKKELIAEEIENFINCLRP